MTAFQAGQLDALTASTTGVLFAASKDVPIVVPVSMARESTKTFSTSYLALSDSDVTPTNLKGKTIGINGYRTSIELYARIAVAKAGLDPDRDVKWLIVPLPQMAAALRQKKIDLGVFPTTFAYLAMRRWGEEGVRFRRDQRHRGGVRRRLQPGFREEAPRGRQGMGVGLCRADPFLPGKAGRSAQESSRLRASSRPIRKSTSA